MPKINRIGVLGCGFFAQNHLHAWTDLKSHGVEIVAVCDTDPGKAAKAAAEFGGVPYNDAREMFSTANLELVDIVTQVGSHRPLVELAIGAGVATIIQKPFGPTLSDCVAMMEIARAGGVPLAVHENFRFQPPLKEIKAILDSGEIGTPNWGRVSFRTGYDIYAGQPYLRTERKFVIADLGAHVLDLARFYFGEVEQVSAQTQQRSSDIAGEDTATMLLRHRSGAVSVVECTYEARRLPDPFPQTIVEIEGSDGSVVLREEYQLHITSRGKTRTITIDPPVGAWMERPWHIVQNSVVDTCRHILEALRQDRAPSVAAADNLKTMALCEAAYVSAANGQTAIPSFA
ncbi:MAG: Gfo/Idh/MocA family oxidoreductase [Devosia sp.]